MSVLAGPSPRVVPQGRSKLVTLRGHISVCNMFDRDIEVKVAYAPPGQPSLSWSAVLRGVSTWCGADADAEAPLGNGSSTFHRWTGQASVAVLPLFVVAGLRSIHGTMTLRVWLRDARRVDSGQPPSLNLLVNPCH